MDPTGTGARTEDGPWTWSAEQERFLFRAALETDPAKPIVPPEDLPECADRLALRAEGPRPGKNSSSSVGRPVIPP